MLELKTRVTELLFQRYGMDISMYDDDFIEKSISRRMQQNNYQTEEEYLSFFLENEKEGSLFLDSLFVSYSEFFRNSLTYAVLENIVLPAILLKNSKNKNKEIRIWSAACAAGQETYSLAMLMNEQKSAEGKMINFRIFATDYSETQVKLAQQGQFQLVALSNLNLKRVTQWFKKRGESYTVKTELKERIDFSVFDLLCEDHSCPPNSIYGDFDFVICANLLFYYKPEFRKKIIDKASHCLSKGGYVITGETEREIMMQYNFEEVFPQSCIFRKIGE
ncbi:MAG TPA: CheR family methyltransferase [Paludibacter sp.]|nr:CheR family methyltransferase [Paludibacter sp.]